MECQCAIFLIKHTATNTSLQNINWLPVSKNKRMRPVYIMKKMTVVPVYTPYPYNMFVYILEGQVYKESKPESMTKRG